MKQITHTGFSPVYTSGKYAEKTSTKNGNYGTDTFTRAKRATRHKDKQDLKRVNLSNL